MKYDKTLMQRLMDYSATYEISFQMWPKQYTIYVAKDSVDLHSYGGANDPNETMRGILKYLDRVNAKANEKGKTLPRDND